MAFRGPKNMEDCKIRRISISNRKQPWPDPCEILLNIDQMCVASFDIRIRISHKKTHLPSIGKITQGTIV